MQQGEFQSSSADDVQRLPTDREGGLVFGPQVAGGDEPDLGADGQDAEVAVVVGPAQGRGGAAFKTPMPANVTEGIGFIRYIKSFRQPVFSEAEVDVLLRALKENRLAPTFATHRQHVQNLKRRSDPIAERLCPKCGSLLVICTVKFGPQAGQQFWGCSPFPKCRTLQSL